MVRGSGWSRRCWADVQARHPRGARLLHELRAFLPPLNFITVHYAYFVIVVLFTSLIFWGSSDPAFSISYVDSLFLIVSAMTEAGLNTINLSQMTTWQQILLWLVILFGGAIWVSIWTVVFRLRAFEKHFESIVKTERDKDKMKRPGSSMSLRLPFFGGPALLGKATTTPASNPALVGLGKVMPNGDARRRTASLPDLDVIGHPLEPGHGAEDVAPPPPTPSARITFADDSLTPGHTDARTTSSVYALENRPRRRHIEASGSAEKADNNSTMSSQLQGFLAFKTAGRNAQFHDLTSEEREQLGGHEYRALKLLSVVVPLYFALWQFLGCISLGAWIAYNKPDVATSNGLNPWWTGIFFGVSAFNNSGMALLDANVVPFQNSYFVLIVMGAMILAGNTAYPILLRFIFWSMLKVSSWATSDDTLEDFKLTLKFILKYPRRVYTNMFPARQTWWLLFMVCLLNVVDWVAFEVLNLGNTVIEAIPLGSRIIDGLFQGIAVRSGGFYVVGISSLYIGLQILYVIMMYISVYPVVITIRHSNVYEERSLGIYADDPDREDDIEQGNGEQQLSGNNLEQQESKLSTGTNGTRRAGARSKETSAARLSRALRRHFAWHGVGVAAPQQDSADSNSNIDFISQQIHGQLAHDLWWLVLAVLAISIIETRHFLDDPVTYSVFNIIFEVVSAYGTVGISTGVPYAAYSFSGGWYTGSKLVLCLVMLRGRHRGLPVALDRAVRLPREQLHRDEEEDHRIRRIMTSRRASIDSRILGDVSGGL
ncbi:cation transport protein-domain-containing protein [Coniella lustricola]|uniref:Potassium transport protein n=1 Tax=Coniella lustricola TaxID=2025994 RepID=A0A2T3AAK6_9PEZI|nr:cation transport protein-domain-containing protein [Coniella lustricola]